MGSDTTPFKGRISTTIMPTRLLRRFTRTGHVAEIRERTVTTFNAIEFIVFIDGSLIESELFHGGRLEEYEPALAVRVKQFNDDGWLEQLTVNC